MSQPYSEAMDIRPSLTYAPCATSLRGKTGDIITLTQFEEGNLLSETRNDAEISDESDDDSIMPPLLSEEEMDAMDSSDESYHDPISTEMLEDICDRCRRIHKDEARKILEQALNGGGEKKHWGMLRMHHVV